MEPQNQQLPPQLPSEEPVVTTPPEEPGQSALKEVLSTVGVLAAALLIALGLIGFVFQSYEVDGPSMQNTLHNQDRLIVWKTARTWSRVTKHQYVPQRGDIIVFVESGLSSYGQADSKQLIKRVLGLPGDHVVVRNGIVTIYNSEHPNGFVPDQALPYSKQTTIPYTAGNIDLTLDQNELFVCGDNRGDSLDSRAFGPIQTSDVVGKLVARVYPFSDTQIF
jgi:signal peptidase I